MKLNKKNKNIIKINKIIDKKAKLKSRAIDLKIKRNLKYNWS